MILTTMLYCALLSIVATLVQMLVKNASPLAKNVLTIMVKDALLANQDIIGLITHA